jgi:hypothetical protein
MGVTRKSDARQIVDLALVPIGRAPDSGHGRDLGEFALDVVLPTGQDHLEHDTVLMFEAPKVIDHLDVRGPARLGGLLLVGMQIVDPADAIEIVEAELGLVAQERADLDDSLGSDLDPGIDVLHIGAANQVAEPPLELLD